MATSLLRCLFALFHESGETTTPFGNTFVATEKVGVGPRAQVVPFVIASTDGFVLVWDGTVAGALRDWSAFVAKIRGSGTLHVKWTKDTPTSESNLAASGATVQTVYESMSCLLPLCKDNNRLYADNGSTLSKLYKCYMKTTEATPVTVDVAIAE